jgi:hypothetical protein
VIFKVKGVLLCDNCGKEVEAVFPFELGGPLKKPFGPKHPEPVEGKAFNGVEGAKYFCARCWEERG